MRPAHKILLATALLPAGALAEGQGMVTHASPQPCVVASQEDEKRNLEIYYHGLAEAVEGTGVFASIVGSIGIYAAVTSGRGKRARVNRRPEA